MATFTCVSCGRVREGSGYKEGSYVDVYDPCMSKKGLTLNDLTPDEKRRLARTVDLAVGLMGAYPAKPISKTGG